MALLMGIAAWGSGTTTSTPGWGGMMAFGWLWMLVPLAMMVAVMYGMMSLGHGAHGGHGPPDAHNTLHDARAVLDRRYAAGELSRDDYLRIREDLDRPPRP